MFDASILVRLMGGLGNQLFQYAAGRALSLRFDAPLKLITSTYKNPWEPRAFKLHHFNISASVAPAADIWRLRLSNLWNFSCPYYGRPIFVEKHFHYDPNITKTYNRVLLKGFWQSERYFSDIAAILRQELTFKDTPDEKNLAISDLIRRTEAVSLHIRRGDYVSNSTFAALHGVCPLTYYYAAVKQVIQTVRSPHFFVFSDEIEWAEQNLHLPHPVTYVSHNSADRDYEDLRLMSQCKHHIIANSTFSWWGAWLCTNPNKFVVAPQKWFGTSKHNTKDLIPNGWIRL